MPLALTPVVRKTPQHPSGGMPSPPCRLGFLARTHREHARIHGSKLELLLWANLNPPQTRDPGLTSLVRYLQLRPRSQFDLN